MELVYERCCGLDVHKKMVVACLILPDEQGKRSKEVRTFRTTTQELLLLRDWLVLTSCTHLAMEATGVYWKPISNVLDGAVDLLVVNARHIKAVRLLDSIPGINPRAAQGILAEIGTAMRRFKSARHLTSWAGMCPGNHESGGKRLSGKTRKGSPWLRQLLVEAAHAAAHSKKTYLSAQYHRIASRRGAKIAMIAVGHSILVMIYHMLAEHVSYTELGGNYFDEHDRQAIEKRLVRRLEKLGYQVELQPPTQVA